MSREVISKQSEKMLAVTTSPCKRSVPFVEAAERTGELPAAVSEGTVEDVATTGALKVDESETGGVDAKGCVPVWKVSRTGTTSL
jgi:hypothetical protein